MILSKNLKVIDVNNDLSIAVRDINCILMGKCKEIHRRHRIVIEVAVEEVVEELEYK